MLLSRNRKLIFFLSILVSVAFLFLLSTNTVHAGVGEAVWAAFSRTLAILLFLPIYLLGLGGFLVLALAALFVDFVFKLNIDVISAPIITSGFKSVLSVANMGFVIAIIIIAFATIFRNQTYGMKQMLWKLVIAAVLVNFSLLIAGVIIDFSHTLTLEFVRGMTGGSSTISLGDPIVSRYGPQNTLLGEAASTTNILDRLALALFIKGLFGAVSNWIMAIIMIGLAFMLLIRYIYLIILLILMPLSWLFWVTPRFTHLHRDWWDKFFQQVLYLPAVTFFVGLASSPALIEDSVDSVGQGAKAGLFQWGLGEKFLIMIINLFIVSGLLVGGMIAAQKLGAAGSGVAMGLAKGAGRKARSYAWAGTKFAAKPFAERAGRAFNNVRSRVGQGMLRFKGVADSTTRRGWRASGWRGRIAKVARGAAAVATLGTSELLLSGTGKAGARMVASSEKGKGKDSLKDDLAKLAKTYNTEKARGAMVDAGATTQRDAALQMLLMVQEGEFDRLLKAYEGREEFLKEAAENLGITDEIMKAVPNRAHEFASNEDRGKDDIIDGATARAARLRAAGTPITFNESIDIELRVQAVKKAKGSDLKNYSRDSINVLDPTISAAERQARMEVLQSLSGQQIKMMETSEDIPERFKQTLRENYERLAHTYTTRTTLSPEETDHISRTIQYVRSNSAISGQYRL